MSVLVCVPTYETITTECYKALWELDDCGHEVWFDTVKGYDCALARISACKKAREYGADWLFMVDSDTTVPHDSLANMVADGVDVVYGYQQWRHAAEGKTCIWKLGDWSTVYTGAELHALERAGRHLVEVQGGGMGCALIRTGILSALPMPWFRWIVRPDGTETGEDVFFADLCREHHVHIWCDTRVACGHVYRSEHGI